MKLETIVTCPCGNERWIYIEFKENEFQRTIKAYCNKCNKDFFFEIERIPPSQPNWKTRTSYRRYSVNVSVLDNEIKIYERK